MSPQTTRLVYLIQTTDKYQSYTISGHDLFPLDLLWQWQHVWSYGQASLGHALVVWKRQQVPTGKPGEEVPSCLGREKFEKGGFEFGSAVLGKDDVPKNHDLVGRPCGDTAKFGP